MHIHHDWDSELNLGGDGLRLNNIESMFHVCFVLFLWKLIIKEKENKETSKEPIFLDEVFFSTLNNDVKWQGIKFYSILTWFSLFYGKHLVEIRNNIPSLWTWMATYDLEFQIENPFWGMLYHALGV